MILQAKMAMEVSTVHPVNPNGESNSSRTNDNARKNDEEEVPLPYTH